jgi:hypothetical protein
MTRIKFLGLAMVAVFATVGVLATAASATTPTWFECAKTEPKDTGKYNDKACSQKNEEGKGKYELKEGLGKGKKIKSKAGASELIVKVPEGEFPIKCGGAKGEATPALPNLEKEVSISFKKCVFLGQKCTTAGAKTGEIAGKGLVGELGYVKAEEGGAGPAPAVGVKIKNALGEAEPISTFECGTGFVKGKLFGAVIGVQESDINAVAKETTLNFVGKPPVAEQYGEHEFEGKKYKPVVNIVGFAEEAEEIKACAGLMCAEEHPAHVIRGEFCGTEIESLVSKECTPLTYSALDSKITNKGESLMIKA